MSSVLLISIIFRSGLDCLYTSRLNARLAFNMALRFVKFSMALLQLKCQCYLFIQCYPYTLVKKPVMVGKVLSVTTSLSGTESSAVEQIWQDWREGHFLDESTNEGSNKNQPKNGICLHARLIGKRQFNSLNLSELKKTHIHTYQYTCGHIYY